MTAPNTRQVVEDLQAAGLSVTLTPDRALKVVPGSGLTPILRDLIRTHKVELVAWLTAANDGTTEPVAFIDPPPHPDRWCWPHSDAMNGAEIDTFTGRLKLFTAKGLTLNDAEVLADKLLIRDREGDDRRVCPECGHLSGWAGRRQYPRIDYYPDSVAELTIRAMFTNGAGNDLSSVINRIVRESMPATGIE